MTTILDITDRDVAIAEIRKALRDRSGKAWSVKGGRGTAWGWLTIDAPPRRCTFESRETGETDAFGLPVYEWVDTGEPGGDMGPEDRRELAELLGLESVHPQGVSIPASADHRREYVARARGERPTVIGEQYWD